MFFGPVIDLYREVIGGVARWSFLFALEQLGIFHILKIGLVLLLVLFIARRLLGRSKKFVLIALVVALAILEREVPGQGTYGLPSSFNPATSQVTFTIDDRTLPGWAEWLRQTLPGQKAGPKVSVEESDSVKERDDSKADSD